MVAASAALLINNRRAKYRREPSIRRERCISGESGWKKRKSLSVVGVVVDVESGFSFEQMF